MEWEGNSFVEKVIEGALKGLVGVVAELWEEELVGEPEFEWSADRGCYNIVDGYWNTASGRKFIVNVAYVCRIQLVERTGEPFEPNIVDEVTIPIEQLDVMLHWKS
jgi:hypothetical protein